MMRVASPQFHVSGSVVSHQKQDLNAPVTFFVADDKKLWSGEFDGDIH
jgi:hypothetical protein